MLLNVKDAAGDTIVVCVQAQDSPTDASGTIDTANTSQQLLAANLQRSGWLFQNQSDQSMTINEVGGDAAETPSWSVPPLGFFPPPGFPAVTGQINVAGPEEGAAYVCREW